MVNRIRRHASENYGIEREQALPTHSLIECEGRLPVLSYVYSPPENQSHTVLPDPVAAIIPKDAPGTVNKLVSNYNISHFATLATLG